MFRDKLKDFLRPYYHVCFDKLYEPFLRLLGESSNGEKEAASAKYLNSLHNHYYGKRCFIIGNGPSLRNEDLEKLESEICFGSHRIYEIFDDTDWRPAYYCAQDYKLIRQIKNDIEEKVPCDKFIGMWEHALNPKIKNAYYIKMRVEDFYPELPKFSEDILQCCYEGFTVTYFAIQIAIYMGFKEIILLGIDHNYSQTLNPDGTIAKQDIKDHFSEKDKVTNIPALYKSTLAYKAAKKYADEHGIKILNATRGGRLEVFDRIDFDSLFKK